MLSPLDTIAFLLTVTAAFSFINLRVLKLPNTIALVVLGAAVSVILFFVQITSSGSWLYQQLAEFLGEIDFYKLVMEGLLAFLLFAGAIKVDVQNLSKRWLGVGSLATIGVFVSATVVSTLLWLLSQCLGLPLNFAWCFVFGALIAPTDPVAVLATLSSVNAPKSLEIDLSGETLFNDGIGVVLFIVALQVATSSESVSLQSVALLFLAEAGGGLLLGLTIGYVGYRAIKRINDYVIEILISLSVVTATYALAEKLHISGPIAVVAAGVLIGYRGPRYAMSDQTRTYMFGFWDVVDRILNSVLFLVIGLEILSVSFDPALIWVALIANPVVLIGRLIAVTGAVIILNPWQSFPKGTVAILTWGAVRGAIPVALALSLPSGQERPYILAATYATVFFSIVFQGLSLPAVIRKTTAASNGGAPSSDAGFPWQK